MMIEEGTKYQITEEAKGFFNSAETMVVKTNNGITVQFILSDSKGHGSMPIDHLNYLLKKANLTQIANDRILLDDEKNDEKIS
ncbi:MAG: hypothetical protein K6T88_05240 [Bacillus sp. (in: Bacteria)]|nr:hypothetical protein [Bacillus sp. (in: firmicutes)]